jgi:hypothetical protein
LRTDANGGLNSSKVPRIAKRAGFSLLTVLIISIAVMSLLGGVMFMFNSFAGGSRVAVSDADVYNTLQTEIEAARAILKMEMSALSGDERPWHQLDAGDKISALADLEPTDGLGNKVNDSLPNGVPRRIGARTGTLVVKIYDMSYEDGNIPTSAADAGLSQADYEKLISELPPRFLFVEGEEENPDKEPLEPTYHEPTETPESPGSGGGGGGSAAANGGVYLIRATITFGDGESKTIETAVVQAVGG